MQGGDLAPWSMAVLVDWSDLDPVSTKETNRNNVVFGKQHNRNPYIDRPEWVHEIWGTILGIQEPNGPPLSIHYDGTNLVVDRGDALPGSLSVRDMAGRILFTRSIAGGSSSFTFNGSKGIYIAEVVSPEGRSIKRFVR